MSYIDYKRLEEIEQKIPPLRGTNKYPYFTRYRTSVKHFKPDVLDGEKVYRVFYSYYWGSEELEAEEYKKLADDIRTAKEMKDWHYQTWSGKYCKYTREEAELGIVRPDNTFEFTATRLHQGDRNILSQMIRRNVFSDVKRGGVILAHHNYYNPSGLYLPLFKGQRINLDTMQSVVNYEVRIPRVDRKKSSALTVGYKDQMKFAEAMFRSMSVETLREEAKAALDKVEYDGNKSWMHGEYREAVEKRIKEVINEDFIEASLLMMIHQRTGAIWSMLDNSIYRADENLPIIYYHLVKKSFLKKLKQTNDVFYDEVFKCNQKYPPNEWGIKVFLNGERVSQYQ